ncbi:hypothetical protein [Actinoplanes xinjiangensis]|uniref:hypothetical protein n=1 Tax=Actinoplanes xinjiangensis TaxID=512350 RepID=UPI00344419B6
MAELEVLHIEQVARRLATPDERWGWEFHEPLPVRGFPAPRPQWSEPRAPYLPTMEEKYQRARAAMPKRIAVVAAVVLVGLCAGKAGILFVLVGLGLAAFWFAPMVTAKQKADQLLAEHAVHREQAGQQYHATVAQWEQAEQAWRLSEQRRVASADRWFPIMPEVTPSRIDVFGGTAEGRAAFLLTLGAGLLAKGTGLTVVDLSERAAADPLLQLARSAGFPYQEVNLPADLHRAGLLDGMAADDVAELIAEALHARRGDRDSGSLLDLDADILKNVGRCLDGEITFVRLVAALRVVQRIDDGRNPSLSSQERLRLAEYVDVLGTGERTAAQVQDLRSTLEALAGDAAESEPEAAGDTPEQGSGLTVFVSEHSNHRRRDLLNRLVVQTLVHRLRQQKPGSGTGDVIAIAAADGVGAEPLKRLHAAAQRAGTRLVLMIDHLGEEFETYLGDAESASIFMRMQNTREAGRAAEYIGRGHTFQLTQFTHTAGTSTTRGTNSSTTVTHGSSESTNRGGGVGGSTWGSSTGHNHSHGQTDGTSRTDGTTVSDGETRSRVYEFSVEPTTFQGLDPCSFVLVDPAAGGGRRLRAGTCDPAVLALDGVADTPLAPDVRAGRPATQGVDVVSIVDPTGMHRTFADKLTQAGYLVSYQQDAEKPMFSGWQITGHRDGRPLNEQEIMSLR